MLANNLGIIIFSAWSIFWKVFWLVIFLTLLVQTWHAGVWLLSVLFASFAVALSLSLLGVMAISFWNIFWPMLVILLGFSLIFNMNFKEKKAKTTSGAKTQDEVAIFWGVEKRPTGKYSGDNLLAMFGGIDLDLRDVEIEDQAIIDVFAFCGGVNIIVPEDVIVDNQILGVLGGVDDKSQRQKTAKKKLIIRGQCIMGGVEVR